MSFPGFGYPPALYFLWVLPKNLFSRICGWVADLQLPGTLLHPVIRLFCRIYRIDLAEAELPLECYHSFNAFFTRKLNAEFRPIPEQNDVVLCPVDGSLGECGAIIKGILIQAKGLEYRLEDLLQDPGRIAYYEGGYFLTIYLAPHNYHRIHSVADGVVYDFAYIPGDLWTVSPIGVKHVPFLFARNERIVTYLETRFGECALVKVGATVVGKISVCYHDQVTNCSGGKRNLARLETPWSVKRGGEIGVFQLGSSVICLFPPGQVELNALQTGQLLQFGQPIGRFNGKSKLQQ